MRTHRALLPVIAAVGVLAATAASAGPGAATPSSCPAAKAATRAAAAVQARPASLSSPAEAPGSTRGALPSKPNVVYIVADDEAADALDMAMPYLTSRPGGSWVRFNNAIANVANCCPSRSSILTGQFAHHHGVTDNGLGGTLDDSNVLPVWLKNAGYNTALVGKYLNNYPWTRDASYVPPGWDRWFAYNPRDSATEVDAMVINDQGRSVRYPDNPRNHSTDLFSAKSTAFLAQAREPFFLYASVLSPHSPFTRPQRYKGVYANTPVPHSANFNEVDVSDKPAWVRALPLMSAREAERQDADHRKQWEAVRAIDDLVKSVYATLEQRGVLDRTMIVFTSDHGLSFGSHRWREAKNCPYDECTRIPLMVRYPGATQQNVPDVVSNVDIGTTLSSVAGVAPGRPQDGRSLAGLMLGTDTTWANEALIQKPRPSGNGGGNSDDPPSNATSAGRFPVTRHWALRTDRNLYVEYATGERELYDLVTDPAQTENIYGKPGTDALSRSLSARLVQLER